MADAGRGGRANESDMIRGRPTSALLVWWARMLRVAGLILLTPGAMGIPVGLRPVEASAPAQPGFPLEAAVDGVVDRGTGWSVGENRFEEQFAVFSTAAPLDVSLLRF